MRKSVPIKPSVQPGHRWPHTVTAVERVEGWRLALADLAVVLEAQKGGPHTGDLPGPPPLHPINAAQSFWPCLAKIVPKMPGEHCFILLLKFVGHAGILHVFLQRLPE